MELAIRVQIADEGANAFGKGINPSIFTPG